MPALDSYILRRQTLDEYTTPIWSQMAEAYWNTNTGHQKSDHTHMYLNDGSTAPVYGTPAQNDYVIAHFPTAASYISRLNKDMQFANNYWVSPDMCKLITAAAESLPVDEEPKPEDFPTEGGFLVIPGGVVETDIRGNACVTSAILWRVVGGGVRLTYLADKHHPLDRLNTYGGLLKSAEEKGEGKRTADEIWNQIPRLTPWHDGQFDFYRPMPVSISNQFVIPPEFANAISVTTMPNGTVTISWPQGYGPEQIGPELLSPHLRPDPVLRWLLACMRIMQQPLAKVSEQGIPAGLRRRAEKAKLRMKNTHVTVIEYRRVESSMPDSDGREFTHRFLRRGHWRMQHYKNDLGEWDVKRIWIHATIVGDESLPLILREHVLALTR